MVLTFAKRVQFNGVSDFENKNDRNNVNRVGDLYYTLFVIKNWRTAIVTCERITKTDFLLLGI